MKKYLKWITTLVLACFMLPAFAHDCDCECPEIPTEPENGVPVTVYRYTFDSAPGMSSTITDNTIEERFGVVNEIWRQADIEWTVDGEIQNKRFTRWQFRPTTNRQTLKARLRKIAPEGDGWKIVYIDKFPVQASGLYLTGVHTLYIAEHRQGNDTNPVVQAHEMGHSLGLGHTSGVTNLMNMRAGGPGYENATDLTAAQISQAQAQVVQGPK